MAEQPEHHDEDTTDVFDVDHLKKFVELMEAHDLSEIDLKAGGKKVRLRRGTPPAPVSYASPPPPPTAAAPASTAGSDSAAAPTAEPDNLAVIKSPMVGTFYSRPNPNAESFVKIGDMVEPETTVCIIEAMKVFNEIPAELRGKIVAVLVKDEEPVEFGTPLFKVDTSAV